jgi:hypothetical protein
MSCRDNLNMARRAREVEGRVDHSRAASDRCTRWSWSSEGLEVDGSRVLAPRRNKAPSVCECSQAFLQSRRPSESDRGTHLTHSQKPALPLTTFSMKSRFWPPLALNGAPMTRPRPSCQRVSPASWSVSFKLATRLTTLAGNSPVEVTSRMMLTDCLACLAHGRA